MKRIVMSLPLLLGACGTLPEPFYGDPGTAGAKLAVPPAPVLVIPSLSGAGLDQQSGQVYASDLAAALTALDVPSIFGPARPAQWHLSASATDSGGFVTPSYAVIGPDGKSYGVQAGAPVAAGPWAAGDPATLNQEATADALAISNKLAAINAAVQQSNPNSLENRPPRVFLGTITGAPGDGDNALALDMRRDLPGSDTEMVTDPASADFTVTGHVKTQPDTNKQILVELDWVVEDSSQRKIGQVTQLHDLSPGDIEPYWGDVAAAAAAEAAAGVNEVITNATLRKSTHLAFAPDSQDDGGGSPLLIPATFALPPPALAMNHAVFAAGAPAPAAEMVAAAPAVAPASMAAADPIQLARPAPRQQQNARPSPPSGNPLVAIASAFRSTASLAGDLIGRIDLVFTRPAPRPEIAAKPALQAAKETAKAPQAPQKHLAAVQPRLRLAAARPHHLFVRHELIAKPQAPYLGPSVSLPGPANPAFAMIRPAVYVITAPQQRVTFSGPIQAEPAPEVRAAPIVPRHVARMNATNHVLAGSIPAKATVPAPAPPETGTPVQDPSDSIER
jgi:hypothetical protein